MLTGAFLFRAIACVKVATPVGAPAAADGAPRRLEPDQKPVEETKGGQCDQGRFVSRGLSPA